MSKLLEWHTCPHCKKEKYCSPEAWRDHLEDCSYKNGAKRGCPQCGSGLMKALDGEICSSAVCDYYLRLIPGGKS